MSIDYGDLTTVNDLLKKAQNAEHDLRNAAREATHFIDKRDGQWEPEIINRQAFHGRPRYTFDKVGPIVDQIAGEIENSDFTLRVRPSGGDASKENAKVYDGLIRNIRNISDAEHVFNSAGRLMVTMGMDGWEVVQAYVDDDCFDQDLMIRKIHNYVDTVWFDANAQEQDNSDAQFVFVLTTQSNEEFKEEFPDQAKSPISVGDDKRTTAYYYKPADVVTTARILYKVETDRVIVRMSDGSIYEVDDDFERVADELAAQGITEEMRRTRKKVRVHSRIFSGSEWLNEAEETEFSMLPVVSTYGNFKITENKRISRGIVEKLIDPQRVYNYSLSRDIEEGALAPRGKYWMTKEQMQGHTKTLASMNINKDPVQAYNHVANQPPPFWQGGATVNAGLQTTASNMSEIINSSAGLFSANMGDNPGMQSGIAIDRQISKGDNGTVKYLTSQEIAICYTGKVLVDTIPRVYDSKRQIRILNQDGSFDMQTLNDVVIDQQTQTLVELNDLSTGKYDVTCEMGASFKSQQREAAAAFAEIAQVDPSIMELARDVWFKNLGAPDMDIVAERARVGMIEQNKIPFNQLTDEEKQEAQQKAQQPPPEDPNMVFARAEEQKAQAETLNAQNKQMEVQANNQVKMADISLKDKQLDLDTQKFIRSNDDKNNVEAAKIQQGQQALDMKQRQLSLEEQAASIDQALKLQQQNQQEINDAINNLKVLRDAMGVDSIVGPSNQSAYINQSMIVNELQRDS
jgi:hypothetical protein